jgi:serine protease Do
MKKKSKFISKALLLVALFTTALYAQQKGWWEKIFPSKTPQVVSSAAPTKALVEPHPDALALQDSFANVVEAVQPAVVNISAVQITRIQENPHEFYYGDPNEFFRRFFGGTPSRPAPPREYRSEGTGSGVIIDPDGYILTNNHVVQGADQLTVYLSDNKSYKGKVIGTDSRTDLAVIKIKGTNPFPFAPLGDSSALRVGDWVLALGSPFGLEKTVTSGIVSAIRQSLNLEGKTFRNMIQTDAAINRGNSGGPLVNLRGQVIGVNTAIYAPTGVFSGIGFAIPVNEAKAILKDLIEKGYVERSWMGVEIAEVNEVIAQQFGLGASEGALINHVVPNSPADKAGIKRGDIVLEFDGKKITTIQSLQDLVSATAPKKSVKVKVMRGGQSKTLSLTTEAMPKQTGDESDEPQRSEESSDRGETLKWLGATVSDITPELHEAYSLKEAVAGILVTDVPSGSIAADAGLAEGDVVQSVNQKNLASVSDLKKIEKDIDAKKGLVLDVLRRGRSFYLTYKALQ